MIPWGYEASIRYRLVYNSNMKNILFMTLLGAFLGIASPATAFSIINESSVAVGQNHTLVMTTFTMNILNRDIKVPLLAGTASSSLPQTTITIPTPTNEPIMAMLLSSSPLDGTFYNVAAGTKATYTLIALMPNSSLTSPLIFTTEVLAGEDADGNDEKSLFFTREPK